MEKRCGGRLCVQTGTIHSSTSLPSHNQSGMRNEPGIPILCDCSQRGKGGRFGCSIRAQGESSQRRGRAPLGHACSAVPGKPVLLAACSGAVLRALGSEALKVRVESDEWQPSRLGSLRVHSCVPLTLNQTVTKLCLFPAPNSPACSTSWSMD